MQVNPGFSPGEVPGEGKGEEKGEGSNLSAKLRQAEFDQSAPLEEKMLKSGEEGKLEASGGSEVRKAVELVEQTEKKSRGLFGFIFGKWEKATEQHVKGADLTLTKNLKESFPKEKDQ